ncbi:GNAT family N-acetyltransferase [Mycobacterium sp. M23085]|uniref:N-acetylglutamate synthase, CG3035 family n=1 Tax=Mycobacterium sp. M23085 TaxID=3378087 RepID=UPI00387843B6
MVSWPDAGTRVTVRYRRPAGSVPPLTDAVGHLLAVDPMVRVQTKTGAVVEFAPSDAVALRVLTDTPVRTSQIRALEHAAAAAWPGAEHSWLDGWLLRAGHGVGFAANSAVPLGLSAQVGTAPKITDWYRRRGLTPCLAVPDRMLVPPCGLTGEHTERVVVRDLSGLAVGGSTGSVTLSPGPDDAWLRISGSEIPVDVLTAVIGGELAFGRHGDAAVARAAVTDAPDGARWVGVWAVNVADPGDGRSATDLCEALLAWGAGRGATRGYMCLPDTGATPAAPAGFRLHHRRRYLPVRPGLWDSV